MMEKYFKDKNFLAGIFFLLFDTVYLFFGTQIPISDSSSVGAGFMPRVYGIIMLIIALILTITSAWKVWKGNEEERAVIKSLDKKDLVRVIAAFISILLYVALLRDVGFIICSIPLMFMLVHLLTPQHVIDNFVEKNCCDENGNIKPECKGEKGKIKFSCMLPYYGKILVFAIIYTIFIYVLFSEGLGLKMPNGILKDILPF